MSDPRATTQLSHWQGQFGNDYTDRNLSTAETLQARKRLWSEILALCAPKIPASIVEIGSNIGVNLRALADLTPATLYALEPNDRARAQLVKDSVVPPERAMEGTAAAIPLPDAACDLAFTSGVLIHIHPDDLLAATTEIVRVARRYVVCIEYFADRAEEVTYRGQPGLLFKRDFGAFYLDHFADLVPLGCGFAWRRMTGLDNLTWWLFRKGRG
jgi:pseudaminic acid biosynthesis-associated methylase